MNYLDTLSGRRSEYRVAKADFTCTAILRSYSQNDYPLVSDYEPNNLMHYE